MIGVCSTCHLLALTYILLVMTQKKTESVSLTDILNFHSFFEGVYVVFKPRVHGLRGVVITIIVICLLCQLSWGVRFMGIDYYFVRAAYDWPEVADNPTYPVTWLSQYYTIIDIPQTLAVFFIVPFLTNWLQLHDALVSSLGHLSLMVVFATPALAPTRTWWYINAVTGIFVPTQTPALRALISKLVKGDEVGKVFAFQSVAMSLGALCWPVTSTIYMATLHIYPATVYLVMLGVMAIVLLITLTVYRYLSYTPTCQPVTTTSIKYKSDEA